MTKEEFTKWVEQHSIECKDGIDKAYEAFEAEVEHSMDHLADCIPYNDPNYDENLRKAGEHYVKEVWDPNSWLNQVCREHDEALERGEIEF